jgi:L-lactate utilization protein LutC
VTSLDTPAPPVVDPAFAVPADRARLERAADAVTARGMTARIVSTGAEARAVVDQLIEDGALVYDTTSRTLEEIGVAADVRAATRYRATRTHTETLDPATQTDEFRRHVSTMDVVVGSVHAVSEDGHVVVASASGSQLASYAFGASRVIWVVGAQKVVPDLDVAFERIERHSYPLEDARLREAYGMPSVIGKQLVVSHEVMPGRITILLVEEALGF